jgi:hypothetical protein
MGLQNIHRVFMYQTRLKYIPISQSTNKGNKTRQRRDEDAIAAALGKQPAAGDGGYVHYVI